MKKLILPLVTLGLAISQIAAAHVVVRPNQVGVGVRQVFTISVPNEKDNPTVAIRLVIPDGLASVTPNVKPGWKIEVKKQATGKKVTDEDGMEVDEQKPVEINWTGGSIPASLRDEFYFQTQVPTSETTLNWKAYQTYADGTVVAWDQTPGQDVQTPYSATKIVNDLTATGSSNSDAEAPEDHKSTVALALSAAALVVSIFAAARRRQPPTTPEA